MKKLFFLFILSPSVFAFGPVILGGESKILYSCEDLEGFSRKKEEREEITFYDKRDLSLFKKGFILRKRLKGNSFDFTVKFRPQENRKLDLDKKLFEKLTKSSNGELKCESDFTYDPALPKASTGCSFKTKNGEIAEEHLLFVEMLGEKPLDLSNLIPFRVNSTSWKIEAAEGPLAKKPVLEKWEFQNQCILELSGRLEVKPGQTLLMKAKEAQTYLKSLSKAIPAKLQGNKTRRVLEQ